MRQFRFDFPALFCRNPFAIKSSTQPALVSTSIQLRGLFYAGDIKTRITVSALKNPLPKTTYLNPHFTRNSQLATRNYPSPPRQHAENPFMMFDPLRQSQQPIPINAQQHADCENRPAADGKIDAHGKLRPHSGEHQQHRQMNRQQCPADQRGRRRRQMNPVTNINVLMVARPNSSIREI